MHEQSHRIMQCSACHTQKNTARSLISYSSRVIFTLNKRKSQEDKLGASKLIEKANKQLTRSCIVVTVIFLITFGRSSDEFYLVFTTSGLQGKQDFCTMFLDVLVFSGYDIPYYFVGRMGFVPYVKNSFIQKIGEVSFRSKRVCRLNMLLRFSRFDGTSPCPVSTQTT